ncbi:hypothetical protein [uncultured Clostridium sp.]|jgi:hypothetical protein|uniref:hypothetical protein n=1 Tax=uncultured Clostridium sp. TaxID=59620 RepID=UPI0026339E07|nr:hypothetical protein [uncultured Clostridium sp.]
MKKIFLVAVMGIALTGSFIGCGANEKKTEGKGSVVERKQEEKSASEGTKEADSDGKVEEEKSEKDSKVEDEKEEADSTKVDKEVRPEISEVLEENSAKTKDKITKLLEENSIKYRNEESKGLERIIAQDQVLKDGDINHGLSVSINYNTGVFKFTDFIGYDEEIIKSKKPVMDLNSGLTKKFIDGIVGENVDFAEFNKKVNAQIEDNYPKLVHEDLEEFKIEVNGFRISVIPNMGMYKKGLILTIESDISE